MTPAVALAAAAGVVAAVGLVELASAPRTRRRGRTGRRLLLALGRRVGAPAPPKDLAERLEAAGVAMTVADAMALKAGTALAAALASLPPATAAPGRLGPVVPAAGAAAGYLALDVYAAARARRRARRMALELPDVLDLLRVVLEAGLPPTRALQEVGRRHGGTLAHELRRAAAAAAVGEPRAAVLRGLQRRAPIEGVAALVTVLERADRLGTPPAEALAALARDAREARARAKAEQAARAAPQIQLIVALLLVPSVMLLVAATLAPALLDAL
jgi:tight adherence protein C